MKSIKQCLVFQQFIYDVKQHNNIKEDPNTGLLPDKLWNGPYSPYSGSSKTKYVPILDCLWHLICGSDRSKTKLVFYLFYFEVQRTSRLFKGS